MKKSVKKTEQNDMSKDIIVEICDLGNSCDKYMNAKGLKKYVDRHNQPKIQMLEEDEDVTVDDVITIGGYLVLEKIYNIIKERTDNQLKQEAERLLESRVEILAADINELPDELKDLLKEITKKLSKED